jgi:hypothetical protein
MWAIILTYATFILKLIYYVLVRRLEEALGEDPWSWIHNSFTLTTKLVWSTLILSTHTNRIVLCAYHTIHKHCSSPAI